MVMAEVFHVKGLGMYLVHGAGGIGHGAHFIGIELLPPVKRGLYIHGYEDLADEFAVVSARYP